jgi:hypothetical protein
MREPQPDCEPSDEAVFRIILHVSPAIDVGVTHWTEAPECPAAHDAGRSADEALERTKERIRAWWLRDHGSDGDFRFEVEHAY